MPREETWAELEALKPLAKKLGKPKPGEWLYHHRERRQSFQAYRKSRPVRKSKRWNTIYVTSIGPFSRAQQRILDLACEYLGIFFDTPVELLDPVAIDRIPESAQREHPEWGDHQLLTRYILDHVLLPNRPANALASLAFTTADLWPGGGWNFVFGEASLRDRTGVWSLYRNGNPSLSKATFQQCLRRALSTATHETGHILTMEHCIVYECSLNGSNSLPESDSKPLHLCSDCLQKHCWNLRLPPIPHLQKLLQFYQKQGFEEDARWCSDAIAALVEELK